MKLPSFVLLIVAWLALFSPIRAADEPASGSAESAAEIARLIEQLGDKQYEVRERAQEQLIKRGYEAFDLLADAQEHDDPEIAMQAGYLVRTIRAEWTREGDPRAVQQILKDYDSQADDRRLQRIRQLADLPGDQGLPWLCRLVRFEKSHVVSRQAALAIMDQPMPKDPQAWARRAETIRASVAHARRPAARWLLAYVQMQSDPGAALATWSELVSAERKVLEEHPQETAPRIVSDMLKRKVELLDRLGRGKETAEVVRQMIDCERGDSASLSELVEWLSTRKSWDAIDEVARRFAASFDLDAVLLYTLCEARRTQGNTELAEATATKALQLGGDNPQEHAAVVDRLVERGLMEWAERELRRIISIGPLGSATDVRARRYLAENLHDRRRDREAADLLNELLTAADKDPNVMQRVRASRQQGEANANLFRSSMSFYYACDAEAAGDRAKQKKYLEKALEQDRSNVDVLIALYRLTDPGSAERNQIVALIKEVIETCRGQIENSPDEPTFYNQVAWLVANTEGDIDEAIRLSQKSVDLARAEGESPKRVGGLLDTLGHCYFAKKDYASAVRCQSEAAALDPHTVSITRQLKVFREALDRESPAKK